MEVEEEAPAPSAPTGGRKRQRKMKKITRCPHTNLKHYAKGMCNHCYHLYGRISMATKCEHKDKLNYAKGMCQNCYFNQYNQLKRGRSSGRKSKK